jgi:hypothetical protein
MTIFPQYPPTKFLQSSAGKEEKTAEDDNVDIEQGQDNEVDATDLQDNFGAEDGENGEQSILTTPATPVKKVFR